jgi:hypothetical protein
MEIKEEKGSRLSAAKITDNTLSVHVDGLWAIGF